MAGFQACLADSELTKSLVDSGSKKLRLLPCFESPDRGTTFLSYFIVFTLKLINKNVIISINYSNCIQVLFIMKSKSSPLSIVILGLENAGKTTLLNTINQKNVPNVRPTLGYNVEIINYKGYKFQTIDIGGQAVFRESVWPHFCTLAQGIIFVFDIFDKEKFKEAKYWYNQILRWVSNQATIIFLANKIDLKTDKVKNYLSLEETTELFELEKMVNSPSRSFRIFEISAKSELSVSQPITWLLEKLTERVKENTKISFVHVFDKTTTLIYSNSGREEEIKTLNSTLTDRITKLKEMGAEENNIQISDYLIHFYLGEDFSIILGTKHNVNSINLLTAAKSIYEVISALKEEGKEYTEQLDGIINTTLVRELK